MRVWSELGSGQHMTQIRRSASGLLNGAPASLNVIPGSCGTLPVVPDEAVNSI